MMRFVLNIISSVEAHSTVNIQDLVNQLEFSVNACVPPENFEWSIPSNSLMYTSGLFSNFKYVNHGKLAFSECFCNTLALVFIPFYNKVKFGFVYASIYNIMVLDNLLARALSQFCRINQYFELLI